MENPSTDSVNPNADPQAKTTKTVTDTNLIAEIPPPVAHKDERSYSHPDPTPLWKIVLEVGAVSLAIVVAWIYYGQLEVMRCQLGEIIRQYPELKKSADAARDAAGAAQQSLVNSQRQNVIEQRAWLKFSNDPDTPFMKGQPISIPVHITNIGRTPAEHLWWAIYTNIVPMGQEPDLPSSHIVPEDKIYKLDRSKVREVNIPHQEFERALLYPTDHDDVMATRLKRVRENGGYRGRPEPFVSPEWEEFAQGKAYIVVFGEVWYLDVFGVTHWTSFCTSKSLSGGNTSRKCAEYGKVDNNAE
jgi:hypothetical protein